MSAQGPGSSDVIRRYLASLGELLPAAVFAKDMDGRYVYVNSLFARSAELGDPKEAIGKLPRQIFDGDRAHQAEDEDQRVLKEGHTIVNRENFDRRVSGEDRWNLVSKVPVRSDDGSIVGLVGLALDIHDRKLAEQAVQRMAEELRSKNAVLERDLELARRIQQSLNSRAREPIRWPHLDLAFAVRQCDRIGGDLVRVARSRDGACLVFICDVMGHGVQSALVASLIDGEIDRMAEELTDPGAYLTELNARFTRSMRALSDVILATALCLRFDPADGSCAFASAAHPLPLLRWSASGRANIVEHGKDHSRGALGLLPDTTYQTERFRIAKGDLIALHTDGFVETYGPAGDALGLEWLCRQIERQCDGPAAEALEDILERFQADADRIDDDASLVLLRWTPSTMSPA